MFVATLFTKINSWKQPKCTLADEWMRKMRYTHTHTRTHTIECYSMIKENEIMLFVATCMDLRLSY